MVFLVEIPVGPEFQSSQPLLPRPRIERAADPPHVQVGVARSEGETRIVEAEADETVVGEVAAVSADGVGGAAEAVRVAAAEEVLDRGPGFVIATEEVLQLRAKGPGVDLVAPHEPSVAKAVATFIDPLSLIAKTLR